MRGLFLTVAVALGLTVSACAKPAVQSTPEDERTTLAVKNDNYLDHVIYLLRGSERIRLGTARGLTTTRFTIPPQYVFGVSSLQFLADPIGSRITPVSDRVNVSPGDEVQLMIPPI